MFHQKKRHLDHSCRSPLWELSSYLLQINPTNLENHTYTPEFTNMTGWLETAHFSIGSIHLHSCWMFPAIVMLVFWREERNWIADFRAKVHGIGWATCLFLAGCSHHISRDGRLHPMPVVGSKGTPDRLILVTIACFLQLIVNLLVWVVWIPGIPLWKGLLFFEGHL